MICKMFTKYTEEYNLCKKHNVLIVFDDMTTDMLVTELFIRRRTLNISIVFITQSGFELVKQN